MLFSCLLLPRVPINNPSCSETAQLSLRGERWVLTVGFFFAAAQGPLPFPALSEPVPPTPGPLSGTAVSLRTWALVCREPPRWAGLPPAAVAPGHGHRCRHRPLSTTVLLMPGTPATVLPWCQSRLPWVQCQRRTKCEPLGGMDSSDPRCLLLGR